MLILFPVPATRGSEGRLWIRFSTATNSQEGKDRALDWGWLREFGAQSSSGMRRHWRLALGTLALAVAGAALLTAFHTRRRAAADVPYPHELAQVSFAVAGDVIPHGPVRCGGRSGGRRRARLGRVVF